MSIKLDMNKIVTNPEHIAIYKLTIAGVGFLRHGSRNYEFFSHDGDYIGSAPIYRVEPFVAFMRRTFGINRCIYPAYRYNEFLTAPLTYGFANLVEFDTVQKWMDEMFRHPVVLH